MEPSRLDYTEARLRIESLQRSLDRTKAFVDSVSPKVKKVHCAGEKTLAAVPSIPIEKNVNRPKKTDVSVLLATPIKRPVSHFNLSRIPVEIWNHIFNFLPKRSLLQVRKVCRNWNHICNQKQFKAYAYLLTRFPNMTSFPRNWMNAVIVTNKIKPLNESITNLSAEIPGINSKQNKLLIVNGVIIGVSTLILAPHLIKGTKAVLHFFAEAQKRAIEEIMKANPGLTWEQAKQIFIETFSNHGY